MLAWQITLLALPPALIPLLPITFLQPLRFYEVTHAFAQRQPIKAFPIKGLRTLSIATGGGTPGAASPLQNFHTVALPRRLASVRRLRQLRLASAFDSAACALSPYLRSLET